MANIHAISIDTISDLGKRYYYETAVGRDITGDIMTQTTSAVIIGNTGQDVDFKVFSGSNYIQFDAGLAGVFTSGMDIQLKDSDYLNFGTGAALAGDVQMTWDGTNWLWTCSADDTLLEIGDSAATQKSFDMKIYGNAANGADYFTFDASASSLVVAGDSRLDFSSATVLAGNTDGGIIKAGTSGSPVTEDTADMTFIKLYFDNGATSGDNRGIYNRLYLTGAGGGGESLRSFTTISNVAAGTAHGAHISLSFGTTGSITGLGVGVRSTLHVPNQEQSAGTYAGGQSEVYFDGASSGLSGTTKASIHRFIVDGSGHTNDMDIVFEFVGLNTTQWETTFSGTPNRGLKIDVGGTAYWIACCTATS